MNEEYTYNIRYINEMEMTVQRIGMAMMMAGLCLTFTAQAEVGCTAYQVTCLPEYNFLEARRIYFPCDGVVSGKASPLAELISKPAGKLKTKTCDLHGRKVTVTAATEDLSSGVMCSAADPVPFITIHDGERMVVESLPMLDGCSNAGTSQTVDSITYFAPENAADNGKYNRFALVKGDSISLRFDLGTGQYDDGLLLDEKMLLKRIDAQAKFLKEHPFKEKQNLE